MKNEYRLHFMLTFFISLMIINLSGKENDRQFEYFIHLGNHNSLKDIIRNNINKNKRVFLYFSDSTCPPCKKIEEVISKRDKLVGFKDVTLIEMKYKDYIAKKERYETWEHFKVRMVPSILQVDVNGGILNKLIGPKTESKDEKFLEFVRVLRPEKTKEELKIISIKKEQSRKHGLYSKKLRSENFKDEGIKQFFKNLNGGYIYMKEDYGWIISDVEEFNALLKSRKHLRIKKLHIIINAFQGTEEELRALMGNLSSFKNLEYLGLSYLPFFPEEIYGLEQLRYLELVGFQNYSLDSRIENLRNLELLEINSNEIKFPKEISKLKNLKYLFIATKDIPKPYDSIFELENLETLRFNVDDKEELSGISKLKKLKHLILNNYHPEINRLEHLSYLYLNGSKENFTIKNLRNLEMLAFRNIDSLDGVIDSSTLPSLKVLEVYNSINFEEIPNNLVQLNSLKYLKIYSKIINDITIPTSIKNKVENIVIYKLNL